MIKRVYNNDYHYSTFSISGSATITTCQYLSEHSIINSIISASSYTLEVTTTNAWVTVYENSICGNMIASRDIIL